MKRFSQFVSVWAEPSIAKQRLIMEPSDGVHQQLGPSPAWASVESMQDMAIIQRLSAEKSNAAAPGVMESTDAAVLP